MNIQIATTPSGVRRVLLRRTLRLMFLAFCIIFAIAVFSAERCNVEALAASCYDDGIETTKEHKDNEDFWEHAESADTVGAGTDETAGDGE